MSFDPNTGMPVQPPKSGMSGCMKAFLAIGCLGVVFGALCCGGTVYFAKQSFQFNQDPVAAAAKGKELIEADFLDDFQAEGSMEISIPFVGPFISMVFYKGEDDSMVVIGELSAVFAQGKDKAEIEQQFRQGIEQQQAKQGKTNLKTLEEKAKTLKIRGKDAHFSFAHVQSTDPNKKGVEHWTVTGTFEGKGGPAFLMITLPYEDYTEDELAKMLEGIK